LAKAGSSHVKQGTVHYQIALLRLAEGDRESAKAHFRKAVDTHVIWVTQWMWCWVFLHWLENDRAWPPWIPVKQ
jgi:hypothetical protein